jgi:hypothetical protein
MNDRTAAEVMCCPGGCENAIGNDKMCWEACNKHLVRNLHAAGFMIVPRKPTEAMWRTAAARPVEFDDGPGFLYAGIYRAMTADGELK